MSRHETAEKALIRLTVKWAGDSMPPTNTIVSEPPSAMRRGEIDRAWLRFAVERIEAVSAFRLPQ